MGVLRDLVEAVMQQTLRHVLEIALRNGMTRVQRTVAALNSTQKETPRVLVGSTKSAFLMKRKTGHYFVLQVWEYEIFKKNIFIVLP